jgi:alkylation response protein AidB-like acyl-CoA dehydrogenase
MTDLVTMDDLTADEAAVRDLCRDFARNEIAPHVAAWWQEERCPTELGRKTGDLDLIGLLVPPEDGGVGLSTVGIVAALFEVGRVDQSIAAAWQAHLTIGSLPLLLHGARVRARAPAVRQADLEVPGDPVQARRHRRAPGGGAAAGLPQRPPA